MSTGGKKKPSHSNNIKRRIALAGAAFLLFAAIGFTAETAYLTGVS
jgi:hypothetical protein